MMWFRLLFLCLLPTQVVTMIQVWNQNFHVALVQNVSNILHKNDCWICTQMPTIDEDNNWPLIGVLMNKTSINKDPKYNDHSSGLASGNWAQVTKAYMPIALSSLIPDEESYAVPCVIVNATGKIIVPPYCHKTESKIRLTPEMVVGLAQTLWRMIPPQGSGWYWICENEAWKVLPLDKDRACALGAVIPNITIFDQIEKQNGWLRTYVRRMKRSSNPIAEYPMTFHSMIRPLIPSSGLIELEKAIINISAFIEHIENHTLDAIMALQEEVRGLARVVLQNRMVLNFLLASQEGMCTIINSSCCSYIDQNGRISRDLDEIWKQTQILHQVTLEDVSLGFGDMFHKLTSWLPNWTWIKQLFILLIFIISVCIIVCCRIQCYRCCLSLRCNVMNKW